MKRYLLFAFSDYYPCGGWSDFVKDFDTVDELREYINTGDMPSHDNVQIVDIQDYQLYIPAYPEPTKRKECEPIKMGWVIDTTPIDYPTEAIAEVVEQVGDEYYDNIYDHGLDCGCDRCADNLGEARHNLSRM